MKIVKFYTLVLVTALSSAAYAGPVLSTRADVIVLPDDSVVLADPFIDAPATQQGGGPLLQLLNPRIYQTIALYQKVSSTAPLKSSEFDKIFNNLLDKRTKLRFFGLESAEEMNKYCFAGKPVYTIPSGASVQQAACTKGNDTFIVKPLFLKLSIRDQAMLLIHERLTTIADDRGWINFVAIAKYTTGLNTFLNVYSEQARRVYRELTDVEQKNIFNFYNAISEIENRNADYGTLSTFNWNVHKNGGGLVHINSFVDSSAFISLSSVVAERSEVLANSKVINLTFRGTNNYYHAAPIKIAENSSIIDFSITEGRELIVGANSTIKNSYIDTRSIRIGDNVSIVDSSLWGNTIVLKNGIVFQRAQANFTHSDLVIAENQQLVDQKMDKTSSQLYYPAGVVPRPIDLTIKIPLFKCVTNTKSEKKSWNWSVPSKNANGDGSVISGWITYNGRNGLKKEYEYNYSETKIEISFKNFERAKTPVMILSEQGLIVQGDYLKNGQVLNVYKDECINAVVNQAMDDAGFYGNPYGGFNVPFNQ